MESVHVILLDARSGRDPTYFTYGECKGANSRMLIDELGSNKNRNGSS